MRNRSRRDVPPVCDDDDDDDDDIVAPLAAMMAAFAASVIDGQAEAATIASNILFMVLLYFSECTGGAPC
jgi:hypothetical protein